MKSLVESGRLSRHRKRSSGRRRQKKKLRRKRNGVPSKLQPVRTSPFVQSNRKTRTSARTPISSSSSSHDLPPRSQPLGNQDLVRTTRKTRTVITTTKAEGEGAVSDYQTPASKSPPVGGETIFLQPTLGTGDLRQMGTSNGVFRLPVRAHQPPTRTPPSDLHTASQGQRQAQGTAARSQPAPPQECGREGQTRADSFPLSLLPHNEEIGRLVTFLNLKKLNKYIKPPPFKMESLAAVLPELQHNWWGASLDLKDAYLCIAIHPSSRKWLGFAIGEENFLFRSLPFGLSTAPRTFTRVVKVIAEHLRRQGVYVFIYLDHWLLTAPSPEILRDQVHMVSDLVQRLGFIINFQKSTLQPSQKVQFLGSHLDFTKGMVFPTGERVQSVIRCASQLLREATPPARLWMTMLGLIACPKYMLPQSILRMWVIQLHVLDRFRSHKDSLSHRISKTTEVSNALLWWTQPSNVQRGKRFAPLPPASTLTTDASKAGWGAHWGDMQLSGTWSPSLAKKHINLLELWAIHLALRRLGHHLRGKTVLVKCGNMSAVMYINKRGGVRSRSLCPQTILLLKWCQRYQITLQAAHLPGEENKLADALSRKASSIQDKPRIRGGRQWSGT